MEFFEGEAWRPPTCRRAQSLKKKLKADFDTVFTDP
jgi:hypothetical protein